MGDSLLYKLRSGKPPKIFFFLKGYLLMCMPTCFFRLCRKRYLAQVETRSDKDYIYERVNYYTSNPQLSSSASFLRLNVLSSLN